MGAVAGQGPSGGFANAINDVSAAGKLYTFTYGTGGGTLGASATSVATSDTYAKANVSADGGQGASGYASGSARAPKAYVSVYGRGGAGAYSKVGGGTGGVGGAGYGRAAVYGSGAAHLLLALTGGKGGNDPAGFGGAGGEAYGVNELTGSDSGAPLYLTQYSTGGAGGQGLTGGGAGGKAVSNLKFNDTTQAHQSGVLVTLGARRRRRRPAAAPGAGGKAKASGAR